MRTLLLDAGAFVAVERRDRAMRRRVTAAHAEGWTLRTTGAVVAEVWRDPSGRQAPLAALLKRVEVHPVDETVGKLAGVLLGRAGLSDVPDATLVAVATVGDHIATSDPLDITRLVHAAGLPVEVVPP
jgi:hypothetical protein